MTTQIVIIADIHGNIWALDAVLKDIERRGIGHVVNLGDSLYGSLEWAATADRLMKSNIVSISGNQDVEIHAPTEAIQKSADHQRAMRELSAEHIYWLAALPFTYVVDEVFCCHGTPTSDTTYMLEKVTLQGVFLNDSASILGHLHGV